jgi:hypothetical protein
MGLLRVMRGDLTTSVGGPFLAQLHSLFSGTRPQIIEERELLMRFRTRPHVSTTDGPIDLDSGIVRASPAQPADDTEDGPPGRHGPRTDSAEG